MFKMKHKEIGFVKNRKKFFIFSTVLMLAIIISSFVFGVDLDIRFKGGTMVDYSYAGEQGAVDLEQVSEIASDVLGSNLTVEEKFNKLTNQNGFEITLVDNDGVSSEVQGDLTDKLQEIFADQDIKQLSITSVNPTMGKEFFVW